MSKAHIHKSVAIRGYITFREKTKLLRTIQAQEVSEKTDEQFPTVLNRKGTTTQCNSSLLSFVVNFRILSQVVAENFLTEKCSHVLNKSDRRKNEQLKKEGKIRISILIFMYTIQFAYMKVYTKFDNTGSNRS